MTEYDRVYKYCIIRPTLTRSRRGRVKTTQRSPNPQARPVDHASGTQKSTAEAQQKERATKTKEVENASSERTTQDILNMSALQATRRDGSWRKILPPAQLTELSNALSTLKFLIMSLSDSFTRVGHFIFQKNRKPAFT